MKYRIPIGTRCKIAPDDDRTNYGPEVKSKAEHVGEWRWQHGRTMCLQVGASCVLVNAEDVEEVE